MSEIDDPKFWKLVKKRCQRHLVKQFSTPAISCMEPRIPSSKVFEWMVLTEKRYVSGIRVWSDRYWEHFAKFPEVKGIELRTDFLDWMYPPKEAE